MLVLLCASLLGVNDGTSLSLVSTAYVLFSSEFISSITECCEFFLLPFVGSRASDGDKSRFLEEIVTLISLKLTTLCWV